MRRFSVLALASGLLAGVAVLPAVADDAGRDSVVRVHHRHAYAQHKGTRVKGYLVRNGVGGYSFSWWDTINTYGDEHGNRYGTATQFRDPGMERQTVAGPFDSGFFFDTARGLHGGDSPYWN
jgi:hypothetical protein